MEQLEHVLFGSNSSLEPQLIVPKLQEQISNLDKETNNHSPLALAVKEQLEKAREYRSQNDPRKNVFIKMFLDSLQHPSK